MNEKTLESIVPPLDLCRKIPAGMFDKSALLWEEDSCVFGKLPPHVVPRVENTYHTILAPAPTLEEILEALYAEADGCCIHTACYLDSRGWEACVVYECHDDSGYGGDHNEIMDANPATAALRLWLEVEGIE